MIKVINITKRFDATVVLDNVSFEVSDQLVAIFGPTGTGKSVLLKIIVGLLKPDSGDIMIDQGETIGFVFQHSALFDSLTVEENIGLPLRECFCLSEKEISKRIQRVIEMLNLDQRFLDRKVTGLSGGERKIVAIARAIITNPKYLFYDEPTTGLDSMMHEKICSTIKSLSKPGILVTHSLDTIKKIGVQNIFLLKMGKLSQMDLDKSQGLAKEQYE